jgi:hypothetical protein
MPSPYLFGSFFFFYTLKEIPAAAKCSQPFRAERSLSFRTERSEVRNLKAQQATRNKRDSSPTLEMTRGELKEKEGPEKIRGRHKVGREGKKQEIARAEKTFLSSRTERSTACHFEPNAVR